MAQKPGINCCVCSVPTVMGFVYFLPRLRICLGKCELTCDVVLEMNRQVRPSATAVFITEFAGHVGAKHSNG